MLIVGELEIKGYTRACDIDYGECFTFQNDNSLFMRVEDYIVLVASGEIYGEVYDKEKENLPVIPINTELHIIQ